MPQPTNNLPPTLRPIALHEVPYAYALSPDVCEAWADGFNTRLTTTAAPALFEALRATMEYLGECQFTDTDEGPCHLDRPACHFCVGQAAISKATGATP